MVGSCEYDSYEAHMIHLERMDIDNGEDKEGEEEGV